MTTEQIKKVIKKAAAEGLTAQRLGLNLTQPPYNLLPPDATKIMDEYRKQFPNINRPSPPNRYPVVAKVIVTSRVNNGENIQPLAESNYKQSIINRSAVKSFALEVAKEKRAGKFERVSTQFVQGVEAEVEALIRGIGPADDRDIPCNVDFLNRKAIRPKVEEKLNDAIRKIIIRKVCSHPTMGKTLK